MRPVWNVLMFGLLVLLAFYTYLRLPLVRDYRNCFQEAYAIYGEGEKGIIIRRFRLGEEAICAENKAIIITALKCIQATDTKGETSEKEKAIMKDLAQYSLTGPRSVDEMMTEHNSSCPMARTVINFDPRTNTWF